MKSLRICFAGLVALLLLAGCQALGQPASAPPATAVVPTETMQATAFGTGTPSITPLPPPTRRPTSAEDLSLTPQTTPSLMASLTLGPQFTRTRPLTGTITPTNTRFVAPPIGGTPWTPKRYSYLDSYKCSVTYFYPPGGGIVTKPRSDFTAVWQIMNIGKNYWKPEDVVISFAGGDRMFNTDHGTTNLASILYVSDKMKIQRHIIPPKEPGVYTAIWGLRKTNKTEFFCTFEVTVTVVRK